MGGLVSPESAPGSGVIGPPQNLLGIQPEAPAAVPTSAPTASDQQAVKQQVDRDASTKEKIQALVRKKWTDAGYSPAAVEGISRRIGGESGWNPYAMGDYKDGHPTSFSLYQHHNERAQSLAQHIQQNNVDMHDPLAVAGAATDLAISEFAGGDPQAARARAALMKETDPKAAEALFTQSFERPADLKSIWNSVTPEEREALHGLQANAAQTADTLKRGFDEYARIANEAPAGSKERDAAIAEMRKNSQEMMQDYRKMMQNPPVQKPIDAWANFGSIANIVGLLGGLFSRQHMTAAINAGGAAMEAINANNSAEFERQYKTWERQSDMGLKMIEMENADIRSLLEDKHMAIDERNTRLNTLATEMGFVKSIGDIQKGPLESMVDVYEKRAAATSSLKNQTEALKVQTYYSVYAADIAANKTPAEASAHALAVSGISHPPAGTSQTAGREAEVEAATKAKDEQFAKDHPDATQAEKDAEHFKNRTDAERALSQATHAPRSAPAMFMSKFVQEHPDADSDAMAMAAARYRQLGAMEQAFGSGAQGNTIRSLNVAIDHTDVLKQLGTALQNGDVQKINALKNRMLVEFGHEGPVDFDVAKKIVGDEVIKSVLGNNAGTGAERLELQSDFDRAQSPEQLNGVIETARRLMLGQMRGLEFQYAGSDDKRREGFREKLFEHTKEALEGTDKALAPGGSASAPASGGGGVIKYDVQGNRVQ